MKMVGAQVCSGGCSPSSALSWSPWTVCPYNRTSVCVGSVCRSACAIRVCVCVFVCSYLEEVFKRELNY